MERKKLGCRLVSLSGFLYWKDDPHELLSCMRDGDVVVFALGALLGKVGGEGRVPMADIFRCVEDSVTKVARSAFLHMGVGPGRESCPDSYVDGDRPA